MYIYEFKKQVELKIPQIRVCLTEKCDKKCFYCRPEGESCAIDKKRRLSKTDFLDLIREIVAAGVSVIRFTGGEPLLNPDIYEIITNTKKIDGVKDISIVTRSLNLTDEAKKLKEVGLDSVTISIDSLNPERTKKITGVDIHQKLIDGAFSCVEAGLPVKINSVIINGINEDELDDFINLAGKLKTNLKFLDYMILPNQRSNGKDIRYFFDLKNYIPKLKEIAVKEINDFSIQAGGLGIPMPTFQMPNGVLVYLKDSTVGNHYGDVCETCPNFPCQDGIMALRLTCDGKLQRCLYRDDNLVDLMQFKNKIDMQKVILTVLETYKKAKFIPCAWNPTYDK